MKFIHLFIDCVFIDGIIEQFDEIKVESEFYCCSFSGAEVKNVKNKEKIRCFFSFSDLLEELNKRKDYSAVFIHGLFLSYSQLNKIGRILPIVWVEWGYDLYQDKSDFMPTNLYVIEMYKDKTKKLIGKKEISLRCFFKNLRLFLSYFKHFPERYEFYKKRLKYISALSCEFDYIKNKLRKNFVFVPLFYLSKSLTEVPVLNKDISNTVLVNHSAALTGNHLDVLEKLIPYINKNTRLVIPLSYGNEINSVDAIKLFVKENNLENQVSFIEDFLPYEKYAQLLSECPVAVMGHLRQQGLGNIKMMLRMGTKVFLYKDSVLYKQLKADGYKVFSIEDDLDSSICDFSFTNDLYEFNHKKFEELNNYEKYLMNLKKVLQQNF